MARNKATTATKPTHELVVTLTTKKGIVVKLGYVGLFENNAYHRAVAKMTPEQLQEMNVSFSVIEAGEKAPAEIDIDDII